MVEFSPLTIIGCIQLRNYVRIYFAAQKQLVYWFFSSITTYWLIHNPTGSGYIRLEVEDSRIEADPYCSYDKVTVYRGNIYKSGWFFSSECFFSSESSIPNNFADSYKRLPLLKNRRYIDCLVKHFESKITLLNKLEKVWASQPFFLTIKSDWHPVWSFTRQIPNRYFLCKILTKPDLANVWSLFDDRYETSRNRTNDLFFCYSTSFFSPT